MSMTGHQRLELERQRLEQLRLIQASQECTVLAETCEQRLRGIHDVAVQQLAAAELQRIAAGLSIARTQIAAQPDITLPRLQELQTQLQRVVARAEARARAWSDEQTELIARSRSSTALATAAGATTSSPDRALQHAAEATKLAEEGRLDEARAALASAQSGATKVRQNVLDEQVRITIVQGLVRSLGEMGFILVDPYLTNASVVVLEGRMASGRRARFEIQLDGHMEFDLDGYEGQACADDIERVATVLRDQYGVRLGPPQVTWKNPDRLTQGALRGPAGHGGSKGAT